MALYQLLLKKLEAFDKPYQSWISIYLEDAGLDAVFIHTPNENADNFPARFDNIDWDSPIPAPYKDLIDLTLFNVGHYNDPFSGNCYLIQSVNQGKLL